MKNTRQRAAILRVLDESTEPLSAEEVFTRLRETEPAMALSTVYRNLARFCSENLLARDDFGDGASGLFLEKGVGVDEGDAARLGKTPADGGFAAGARPDKKEKRHDGLPAVAPGNGYTGKRA